MPRAAAATARRRAPVGRPLRWPPRGHFRRQSSAPLSAGQVEAYGRDGYVVPDWRLDTASLAAGRRAMDEILRRNPDVMPEQLVNAHLADPESAGENKVRGCHEFLTLASLPPVVDMVVRDCAADQ